MSVEPRLAQRSQVLAMASGVAALPAWASEVFGSLALDLRVTTAATEILSAARRGRPALVLLDAGAQSRGPAIDALRTLKADAYTAVVPCLALADADPPEVLFGLGADEVLLPSVGATEAAARVAAMIRRSQRDLSAQPTTHLPASRAIEAEVERRIGAAEPFAVCYADLDHFKEYNDRYGYYEGDRMIRVVAMLLHDVAVGLAGGRAFVGHIGGDDFLLVLPVEHAAPVCALALELFDELVPHQYSDADRRAGYYFGKDRRGQLHRVPLMSLSIGVATSERRRFRSAAEVSRLATEMKAFAKAQPGSVFAVDRRAHEG